MTARPIRYQRQVSDRKGKIFYTSITSLSHISKFFWIVTIWYLSFIFIGSDFSDSLVLYIRHFVFCVNLTTRCRYIHISHLYSFNQDTSYITIYGNKKRRWQTHRFHLLYILSIINHTYHR